MRGRMQGVFIVVVAGGPRLGDVRAGATAAAFGVTAAWVGGGLVCAALVVLALLVPALRRYDAHATASPRRDSSSAQLTAAYPVRLPVLGRQARL